VDRPGQHPRRVSPPARPERGLGAVYGLVTVVGAGIAWPLLLRHVGSLDSWRITRSLVRMVLATVPGLLWVLVVMAVAGSAFRQGTFYSLASVIIGGGAPCCCTRCARAFSALTNSGC
jgi:hypothetical protein